VVAVGALGVVEPAIGAVSDRQHERGEGGGEQAAGQDGDLDVLVAVAARAEATSPMRRDTVNPIPASSANPNTSTQARPSSSSALVSRETMFQP